MSAPLYVSLEKMSCIVIWSRVAEVAMELIGRENHE